MQKAGTNDGWHLKGSAMHCWQALRTRCRIVLVICYTCLCPICS